MVSGGGLWEDSASDEEGGKPVAKAGGGLWEASVSEDGIFAVERKPALAASLWDDSASDDGEGIFATDHKPVVPTANLWGASASDGGDDDDDGVFAAVCKPVPVPVPEPEPEQPQPEDPESAELSDPEPEPEPVADGATVDSEQSLAGDMGKGEEEDGGAKIRRKIAEFLGDIPIGRPGAEGATSERGFDHTPLIEFAEREGLHDASAEEIYCMFVEAKTREAEAQLMDGASGGGSSTTQSVEAAPHTKHVEPDCIPVAHHAQYAALYAAGAVRIRKQQQQQQTRKSTKIAQLRKERDDALWTSSQLQMRCDATDEIVRSLQEQAEHSEAIFLTAMEEIQELRDKLSASDSANGILAAELDRTKCELRECRNDLESMEMELQMETSLAQSLSRENRRLTAEHAAAVEECETAKASEAAMKTKLGEVEHIM